MNESKTLRPWDWALLGAALIACGLFFLTRQDPFACFPGVGIPMTYLGLSLFFVLYLRVQKRLCLSVESVFLFALTLLLSASYGLYARPDLECLLSGLYALFGDTILPTLTERVEDMFEFKG